MRSAPSIDEATARVYLRAVATARAALNAGAEGAARAARTSLADVDDVDELRRIAGALAHLAVAAVPHHVRRGRPTRYALDATTADVLLRAS